MHRIYTCMLLDLSQVHSALLAALVWFLQPLGQATPPSTHVLLIRYIKSGSSHTHLRVTHDWSQAGDWWVNVRHWVGVGSGRLEDCFHCGRDDCYTSYLLVLYLSVINYIPSNLCGLTNPNPNPSHTHLSWSMLLGIKAMWCACVGCGNKCHALIHDYILPDWTLMNCFIWCHFASTSTCPHLPVSWPPINTHLYKYNRYTTRKCCIHNIYI